MVIIHSIDWPYHLLLCLINILKLGVLSGA